MSGQGSIARCQEPKLGEQNWYGACLEWVEQRSHQCKYTSRQISSKPRIGKSTRTDIGTSVRSCCQETLEGTVENGHEARRIQRPSFSLRKRHKQTNKTMPRPPLHSRPPPPTSQKTKTTKKQQINKQIKSQHYQQQQQQAPVYCKISERTLMAQLPKTSPRWD